MILEEDFNKGIFFWIKTQESEGLFRMITFFFEIILCSQTLSVFFL